jgi:hypothetical protein
VTRRPKDPELEEAAARATLFMQSWDGPGRVHPLVAAHRDPETGRLTYVVRFLPEQFTYVKVMTGDWGCRADVSADAAEKSARQFTEQWDGPAHEELPHVDVDRAPILTYVVRFMPDQFAYLGEMVTV